MAQETEDPSEKRKELFERKLDAQGAADNAKYLYGEVQNRHNELTTQMFGAVTPEDRYRYKAEVDEHADKLRNAQSQFENRKAELTAATDALSKFDEEQSKVPDRMGIAAASAAKDLHDLAEGMLPPDAIQAKQQAVAWLKDVTWPYVRDVGLGVAIQGEAQNIQDAVNAKLRGVELPNSVNISEKVQELIDADAHKLEADKAFHAEQLAAVDKFKTEVESQVDASKAEMQKVMGSEWSPAGQKEFAQTEFNAAFQKANDFIAEQRQERDNFFASNLSVLSPVEQQQNRTGMNEELHAAHHGMTRDLAVKQAEIKVDLGNKEMEQLHHKKLEGQGVPPNEMQSAMEPLHSIQQEQRPNDVYMEANKIHAQQCPELAMNPPSQQGPSIQM